MFRSLRVQTPAFRNKLLQPETTRQDLSLTDPSTLQKQPKSYFVHISSLLWMQATTLINSLKMVLT